MNTIRTIPPGSGNENLNRSHFYSEEYMQVKKKFMSIVKKNKHREGFSKENLKDQLEFIRDIREYFWKKGIVCDV
jgi:hypothetical protein